MISNALISISRSLHKLSCYGGKDLSSTLDATQVHFITTSSFDVNQKGKFVIGRSLKM